MTTAPTGPLLRVHRDGDVWRWTYREPAGPDGHELELTAAIAFVDLAEAEQSARSAYPSVPILIADDAAAAAPAGATTSRGSGAGTHRQGWPRRLLVAVVTTLLGLVIGRALLRSSSSRARRS